METILVADDAPENLRLMTELLMPLYKVLAVTSGEKALRAANAETKPDLILLDIMMPNMDGFEVLRRLKAEPRTASIPVIFITAMSATEDEEQGLSLGAVDYVTKPIKPAITLARIKAQLELKSARDILANRNASLEAEVARRMKENVMIQEITIRALGYLAEIRDPETGNHIRRTQGYVQALCDHLKTHPDYSPILTPNNIQLLVKSAPLHDIGKVGIPDHILLKPGKLTPEEWVVMRTHAALGAIAIEKAEAQHDIKLPFLVFAKQIARHHHEKWDGQGYPDGLRGTDIPVSARLMALADVFDALISRRPYKEPFPIEKAVAIITDGRGSHFDPTICDAFLAELPQFQAIAKQYQDTDEDLVAKASNYVTAL